MRVATTRNGNDGTAISKSLIDHFATNKQKYMFNVDTMETGMVDHYMTYRIRKINSAES